MILRPATRADCLDLAERLRQCDLDEIALGSGWTPKNVLLEGLRTSPDAQAIVTPEGVVAGIWGVAHASTGVGSIWMLGSADLETIPLSFLRACKPALKQAHKRWPCLACAPWRENALHLKWLRWIGFKPNDVGHPHFIPHYRYV